MIPKEGFVQDVLASFGTSGKVRIYSIPRVMMKGFAAGLLPQEIDDNYYASSNPDIERSKDEYRAFLVRMWGTVARLRRIDAVVTGNFSYYAERELAGALQQLGVPFIVMHKENMKSAGRVDFFVNVYRQRRGPFTGRRILVYNHIEREVQIRAGVAEPDRIKVCGMPRLDRIHEWRRANVGIGARVGRRPRVLFFSFSPKTGLRRMGPKARSGFTDLSEPLDEALDELSWDRLFRDTHLALVRFARENPGTDVVIKTKTPVRETKPLKRLLAELPERPANLKVVRGGDPFELLVGSDVVCGFNTTGLMEGIASGKPVVVPRFAEAADPTMAAHHPSVSSLTLGVPV